MLLSLMASAYGRVAAVRNWLYDEGIFEVHDLGELTISIGNITAGGTGKTPLVAYVAELLANRGEKVCILTRGYGRADENKRVLVTDGKALLADAATGGDEPVELAQKLLGKAIVIADADRVAAAEWARRRFGVTAFVLDDAFQHRRAKRDVDIVCIDATDAFGEAAMLPVGRLREATSGLARAHIVLITRADLVSDEVISNLRSEILDIAPDAAILTSRFVLTGVRPLNGLTPVVPEQVGKVFAFCAIGAPENFFRMLLQTGFEVVGRKAFRDHHTYSQRDITALQDEARKCGATCVVTTAKDAVKIDGFDLQMPLLIADIRVEIDEAAALERLL